MANYTPRDPGGSFFDQTFEEILRRAIARIRERHPNVDTREGSILHAALAPFAAEHNEAYSALDIFLNESFADTASRYHLIKRAAERGMRPLPATHAIARGEFTPTGGDLIGRRFVVDGVTFAAFEREPDGTYGLRCETPGEVGNISDGKLIPVDFINSLETARIVELLIPGREEEETEAFRQRYFDSFLNLAYGGNVAQYREWVIAMPGVGARKIYPVWNGGGTVRVSILGSDLNPPSAVLIDDVQTRLDPIPNNGEGLGLAPIGHWVTVTGAQTATIDIAAALTYQVGFNWVMVQAQAEAAIEDYFAELTREWGKDWDAQVRLVVRISQIETRLLGINGILDISGTTLNGQARNIELGTDDIPARGVISIG